MQFDVDNQPGRHRTHRLLAGARRTAHPRRHAVPPLRDHGRGPVGRRDERRSHPPLVRAGERRPRAWRTLPDRGQRRRDLITDVRTPFALRPHLGVRRRRELGRGACLGRGRRPGAADAHPHRAPLGALGHLRAGRGRRRLGAGSPGTGPTSGALGRAEAGRGGLRHVRRTAGHSPSAAARVGAGRRPRPARTPTSPPRRRDAPTAFYTGEPIDPA